MRTSLYRARQDASDSAASTDDVDLRGDDREERDARKEQGRDLLALADSFVARGGVFAVAGDLLRERAVRILEEAKDSTPDA